MSTTAWMLLKRHHDWLLIGVVAAALLIAPWRFTEKIGSRSVQRDASYALIFSPPTVEERFGIAQIDTTRYAAQVLAAVGICALIYARLRAARQTSKNDD